MNRFFVVYFEGTDPNKMTTWMQSSWPTFEEAEASARRLASCSDNVHAVLEHVTSFKSKRTVERLPE